MNLTKAQRLKDERVLAAIIAGGEGSGRPILPALSERTEGHGNAYGVEYDRRQMDGPACAVGAGLLFAGIDSIRTSARYAFAKVHGVSAAFATGVSDGFEGLGSLDISNDYQRGVAVGEAAFDYFCDDEHVVTSLGGGR